MRCHLPRLLMCFLSIALATNCGGGGGGVVGGASSPETAEEARFRAALSDILTAVDEPALAAEELELSIAGIVESADDPEVAQSAIARIRAEVINTPALLADEDRVSALLHGWMPARDRPASPPLAIQSAGSPTGFSQAASAPNAGTGLVIIFMNGVNTNSASAIANTKLLAQRIAPDLPGARVVHVWNRTLGFVRDVLAADEMNCSTLRGVTRGWDETDLQDTRTLARHIEDYVAAGSKVLLIPHSQGNYLVKVALSEDLLNPAILQHVGVVMTGSPMESDRMPALGPRLVDILNPGDPLAQVREYHPCDDVAVPVGRYKKFHYFANGYLSGETWDNLRGAIISVAINLYPAGFDPTFRITSTRPFCKDGTAAVELTWSNISGTLRYEVRRGSRTISKPLRGLTFIDPDAEQFLPGLYSVRSLGLNSPEGDLTTGGVYVPIPEDLCAEPATPALTLKGTTCVDGRPAVSLSWSAGSAAHGFRVLRDGVGVSGSLAASELGYIDADDSLQAGASYVYTLRALGGGGWADSPLLYVDLPGDVCSTSGLSSDLVVDALTLGSTSGSSGSSLSITTVIRNRGTTSSTSCKAKLRLADSSSDVYATDPFLDAAMIPALAPGATYQFFRKVAVPFVATGAWYVWCIADVNHTAGQSDETNDKAYKAFSVVASNPSTPKVTSVSPNPVSGNYGSQTLTINGSGFVSGCTATLKDLTNGGTFSGKPATFTSAGKVSISANFTNYTASWTVQIVNPSGKKSSSYSFSVNATTPKVTSVSPSPVPGKDGNQTITIRGSNFGKGCTATLKDLTNGGTYSGKATTFTSSSKVSITAWVTNNTATWTVQIVNPSGKKSSAYSFSVSATTTTPKVTSVSPDPVSGNYGTQTLTIRGSGFVSGCTATLKDLTNGGTYSGKKATLTSASKVSISANFTNYTATWTVQIVNPSGKKSSAYSFRVTATTPKVTSVSPSPVPGKDGNQTITIKGSKFGKGCTATLKDLTNGGTYSGKATTFTSSSKVSITAWVTNNTATWSVQIVNPSGKKSSAYAFSVVKK